MLDGSTFGVFGATPVSQRGPYTQTYSAAGRTNFAMLAYAITDSTGGVPSTTLSPITGGGTNCENATKNAIASLADQVKNLMADVVLLKQLCNGMIDDQQALGFWS